MPALVSHGAITSANATAIERYYDEAESRGTNFGFVVLAMVSVGIILIIAHNWDDLSRPLHRDRVLSADRVASNRQKQNAYVTVRVRSGNAMIELYIDNQPLVDYLRAHSPRDYRYLTRCGLGPDQ